MPNPPPFSDDERARLRDLHGAGRSLVSIARELGRSRDTVSRAARAMGLTFDRTRTAAATETAVADAKARRAALAVDLLGDAQKLRDRLFSPAELHSFGGSEHTHRMVTLDMPVPRDQRDLMGAISQAVQTSVRLDEHDSDSGAGEAIGMVGALFDQLRTQRPPDPPAAGDDEAPAADEEVTGA